MGPQHESSYYTRYKLVCGMLQVQCSCSGSLCSRMGRHAAVTAPHPQGAFIHCGTAAEYLHHMCHSSFTKQASLFSHEAEVKYVGTPPDCQGETAACLTVFFLNGPGPWVGWCMCTYLLAVSDLVLSFAWHVVSNCQG